MTLDEAVAATLKMESYLSPSNRPGMIVALQPGEPAATVAAVDPIEQLTCLVEWLAERIEKLERSPPGRQEEVDCADRNQKMDPTKWTGRPRRPQQLGQEQKFDGACWHCYQCGHIARNCPRRHTRG